MHRSPARHPMTYHRRDRLRIQPRAWIGVAVWAGYVAFVIGIGRILPHVQDLSVSGGALFLGAGVMLICGTVLVAATTTALGWWHPAINERHRSRVRWPMIAPLAIAVLAVGNLVITDWASYDLAFFGASLVLLLVGFTEEMVCRGLLLTGLRARFGEPLVWLISTSLFAVMHFANSLDGRDLGSVSLQVLNAFLMGTTLYILRRVSGSLWRAMALHAAWDFSVFAVEHGQHQLSVQAMPFVLAGVVLVGLFSLVSVAWVIREGTLIRLSSSSHEAPVK